MMRAGLPRTFGGVTHRPDYSDHEIPSAGLTCQNGDMVAVRARAPNTSTVEDDVPVARADEEATIARVAAARKAGADDEQGVEELLRRAADRNRAALDRLAQ